METFEVFVTAPAEGDILHIGQYIYEQLADSETALRVMVEIRDAIGKLEMMPGRFPLVGRRRLARKGYQSLYSTTREGKIEE